MLPVEAKLNAPAVIVVPDAVVPNAIPLVMFVLNESTDTLILAAAPSAILSSVKNPEAKKLSQIGYDYILENHLSAIDTCAASFAMDNKMCLHIFGLDDSENIYRVITGEKLGTIIK